MPRRPTLNGMARSLIYHAFEDRCVICGSMERLELHHIKPFTQGGTDALENLTCLCFKHHRELPRPKKGTSTIYPTQFDTAAYRLELKDKTKAFFSRYLPF